MSSQFLLNKCLMKYDSLEFLIHSEVDIVWGKRKCWSFIFWILKLSYNYLYKIIETLEEKLLDSVMLFCGEQLSCAEDDFQGQKKFPFWGEGDRVIMFLVFTRSFELRLDDGYCVLYTDSFGGEGRE